MNTVQKSIKGMMLFAVMLVTVFTHASGGHGEDNHDSEAHGNQIDTAEEIRGYIKHHLQDSHDFVSLYRRCNRKALWILIAGHCFYKQRNEIFHVFRISSQR